MFDAVIRAAKKNNPLRFALRNKGATGAHTANACKESEGGLCSFASALITRNAVRPIAFALYIEFSGGVSTRERSSNES